MRQFISLLALAFLVLFCGSALAQTAPKLLPFQGRLADQNGLAVSNGVRLVQFKIYGVPTGGSPVWAGELHRTTVNGGLVNVLLGSKTPFTGVDFDQQLYLEITVDINADNTITLADPPMLPRQAILPVVFAKEAADSRLLDGYDWTALFGTNNPGSGTLLDSKIMDGSLSAAKIAPQTITNDKLAPGIAVPIGGVIMWWGAATNVPPGFEICDGLPPSTAGAVLAGNKPDLRDRFVKGAPTGTSDVKGTPLTGGTNTIAARTTGAAALTIAQLPPHNHSGTTLSGNSKTYVTVQGTPTGSASSHNAQASIPNGAQFGRTDAEWSNSEHTHNFTTSSAGSGQAHDHSISSHDNRPAFLEMFFLIRVK